MQNRRCIVRRLNAKRVTTASRRTGPKATKPVGLSGGKQRVRPLSAGCPRCATRRRKALVVTLNAREAGLERRSAGRFGLKQLQNWVQGVEDTIVGFSPWR